MIFSDSGSVRMLHTSREAKKEDKDTSNFLDDPLNVRYDSMATDPHCESGANVRP